MLVWGLFNAHVNLKSRKHIFLKLCIFICRVDMNEELYSLGYVRKSIGDSTIE